MERQTVNIYVAFLTAWTADMTFNGDDFFIFHFLSVCILAFVRDRTCYQLLGKFNLHIFTWHVLLDHFSVSWQNIICVSIIPLTLIQLIDDKQNLMKVDTTLPLQKEARILQFTKDQSPASTQWCLLRIAHNWPLLLTNKMLTCETISLTACMQYMQYSYMHMCNICNN